MRNAFDLEAFANAIARSEVGGTMKPINSKSSSQDGLNPSFVELDEIHAHKTPDLLNDEGNPNESPWGKRLRAAVKRAQLHQTYNYNLYGIRPRVAQDR